MKKEKVSFVDQSTYDHTLIETVDYTNEEPITEPGQAYTIAEILKIHLAGGMVDLGSSGRLVWPEDSDGFNPEEIAKMDAVDRERFARETLLRAKEQRKAAAEAEDKAKAELAEAKKKRLAEKRAKLKEELRAEITAAGKLPASEASGA